MIQGESRGANQRASRNEARGSDICVAVVVTRGLYEEVRHGRPGVSRDQRSRRRRFVRTDEHVARRDRDPARGEEGSEHGQELRRARDRRHAVDRSAHRTAGAAPLLRRADLPPCDQELHAPGRLPPRSRHRRPRLPLRRRVRPLAASRPARRALDGQRGPRNQRLAVLHHRSPDAAPQRQAQRLRLRRGRHGRGDQDRRRAEGPGRSPPHRRQDHERRSLPFGHSARTLIPPQRDAM